MPARLDSGGALTWLTRGRRGWVAASTVRLPLGREGHDQNACDPRKHGCGRRGSLPEHQATVALRRATLSERNFGHTFTGARSLFPTGQTAQTGSAASELSIVLRAYVTEPANTTCCAHMARCSGRTPGVQRARHAMAPLQRASAGSAVYARPSNQKSIVIQDVVTLSAERRSTRRRGADTSKSKRSRYCANGFAPRSANTSAKPYDTRSYIRCAPYSGRCGVSSARAPQPETGTHLRAEGS